MPNEGPSRKDVMLVEFKALRDEIITAINTRIWGTLTYVVVAGGIGAWYAKDSNPVAALLLILAASPLLWHTILRERSRIRIGSYIKVVLEPELEGLFWERSLQKWRNKVPSEKALVLELDMWCHILSLTGIHTIGSVVGLVALLSYPRVHLLKALGIAGGISIFMAHVALRRIYSSSAKYDLIFKAAIGQSSADTREGT